MGLPATWACRTSHKPIALGHLHCILHAARYKNSFAQEKPIFIYAAAAQYARILARCEKSGRARKLVNFLSFLAKRGIVRRSMELSAFTQRVPVLQTKPQSKCDRQVILAQERHWAFKPNDR